MRYLFYSHDGMGLGHVRRHLAIAAALTEAAPEAKVLVTTSVDEVSRLGLPPHVDTLKLPSLQKVANERYSSRRLGLPPSEIRSLRSALLLETVKSFRPAVIVVDKHPFGAGGEFRAALEAAKSSGARAVLGLRDILDDPVAVLKEWSPDHLPQRIGDYYALVLVYGTAAVFDPISEYGFPPALSERTKYCGYVVNRQHREWQPEEYPYLLSRDRGGRPVVLATAGGGEDGFGLLSTFIRAASGASWKGLAVAGPMMAQEQLRILRQLAAENDVELQPFVPCLPNLFRAVDGLVCMGGYNTLVEAVSQGLTAVCVPRSSPRTEQLLRARAFERLGLLRAIPPEQLTVEKLRTEVTAALDAPRRQRGERANCALDFDGARRTASHLRDLMGSVRRTRAGQLEPVIA